MRQRGRARRREIILPRKLYIRGRFIVLWMLTYSPIDRLNFHSMHTPTVVTRMTSSGTIDGANSNDYDG